MAMLPASPSGQCCFFFFLLSFGGLFGRQSPKKHTPEIETKQNTEIPPDHSGGISMEYGKNGTVSHYAFRSCSAAASLTQRTNRSIACCNSATSG